MIVLTGGVPKNHKTEEGKLMADWLIDKGVSKDRIIEENYATSTVGNALFSSYALARHNIKHATIIGSANYVRRGQTLFEVASWQTSLRALLSIRFLTQTSHSQILESKWWWAIRYLPWCP